MVSYGRAVAQGTISAKKESRRERHEAGSLQAAGHARGEPTFANGQAVRGTADSLLHNRLHDGVLELSAHFADGGLDHHHGHDFFLGVDPEVRSVGAAPTEAAV